MADEAGRGCLAASLGSVVGGLSLGGLVLLLVHERAGDAENGLFHDPDAGLLFLVPLAAWIGTSLGSWAGMRLGELPQASSTGCAVAAVFPFAVILALGTYSPPSVALAPFAAGLVGWLIAGGWRASPDDSPPRDPSEDHGPS